MNPFGGGGSAKTSYESIVAPLFKAADISTEVIGMVIAHSHLVNIIGKLNTLIRNNRAESWTQHNEWHSIRAIGFIEV